MAVPGEFSDEGTDLRKQAEAIMGGHAAASPEAAQPMSLAATQALLHELEVHQVELELQNEELRRAQRDLEASRSRYFEHFELAPVGYCTVSGKGLLQEANMATTDLLGLPRAALIHQPFSRFILPEDQDTFYLLRKRLLEQGGTQGCELRLVQQHCQGRVILQSAVWVQLVATAAQDDDCQPVMRVVLTDIDARKRQEFQNQLEKSLMAFLLGDHPLEERLEHLLGRYEALLPGLSGAVLALQDDRCHFRILAAPSLSLSARKTFESMALSPSLAPEAAEALISKPHLAADINLDPLFLPLRPLGSSLGLRSCWSLPIPGAPDEVLGILAFFSDSPRRELAWEMESLERAALLVGGVLVRQRSKDHLLESEARFRLMADQAPVLIWLSDQDQLCTYFNQTWLDFTGRTPEQDAGNGWAEGVHPDDLQRCLEIYTSHFDRRQPFRMEYRLRNAAGEYRWLLDNGLPRFDFNGAFLGYIGSCIDLTDRVQSETALEEANQRMEGILEGTHVGTWEWNVQTGETVFNETWAEFLGHTLADLAPISIRTWEALCHPDDLKGSEDLLLRHFAGELPYYDYECRMKHKDGHWVWMHDRGRLLSRTGDGRPLLMFGTHADISARKESEAVQFESLERLRKIAASVPGVIYQYRLRPDGSSCFPYASEAIRDIYRVSPEEVAKDASRVFSVLHPEDLALVSATIQESALTLEPWVCKYRVRFEDGTVRTLLGNAQPQREDDGSVLWHGFITDITERQRQEAQLNQLQKMQGLGALASGVAHDMNNVLGAILGLASVHVEIQDPGSSAYRAFELITRACERGGSMIRRLLGFARQSLAEDKELDLNTLVQDQVMLLERTTETRIRLEMDLAADLHPMRGDASALAHLLLNLSLNALDAMPDTGSLRFRTRNADEQWIELLVEDTGCGMPAEVLAKAMEPFFTTKEQGKGTGLGLSIVHSTVLAHRGQIQLDSEPGQGTRVLLRFPACARASKQTVLEEVAPAPLETSGTSLSVLLVDDDELIQSSIQMVLEALGHGVMTVSSGEEALAKLEAGLLVDLVILDMNMPGLGGAGTLPHLRALRPKVPVLLATGRIDQTALTLASAHPGVTLLPKPFGQGTLRNSIKSLGLG